SPGQAGGPPSPAVRNKARPSQVPCRRGRKGPNLLTTFQTPLGDRFKGRTAQPLGPTPAPGCDEPTSRCQTIPSIWTLGEDQPVIPGVPFIRLATALPLATAGSLVPAFAPVRHVCLTVKHPCALALDT